jgi:hypothetical protein
MCQATIALIEPADPMVLAGGLTIEKPKTPPSLR